MCGRFSWSSLFYDMYVNVGWALVSGLYVYETMLYLKSCYRVNKFYGGSVNINVIYCTNLYS